LSLQDQIEAKLRTVCNDMLRYLNAVKVVSRLELFVKARAALAKVQLSADEEELIGRKYDLRPDQLTVISIIGETPYMMGCPFLHEETRLKNVLFYHSHTFSPNDSDLDSALLRLRDLRVKETDKMISNMLSKAGYSKTVEDPKTGIKTYKKQGGAVTLECIILESIKDAVPILGSLPQGSIVGVPTEDTPAPFISVYRNHRSIVTQNRLSIIVANIEDLRTSPFLGYPEDKDLISMFDEPDLVAKIKGVWGEEEDEEQLC